jgi:hypothetical protein
VTRVKPAEVRFYLDADILGLAHVLARLRADVTYPGDPGAVIQKRERPPCPIASTVTPDRDWIREVAARGWLIVTRDKRIQDHRAEIAAVRQSGCTDGRPVQRRRAKYFRSTRSGHVPVAGPGAVFEPARTICLHRDTYELPSSFD